MKNKIFDLSRHISWETGTKIFIKKITLATRFNVDVRTIDNWVKSSKLPEPIRKNGRVLGWLEDYSNE
ncbi:hypothetical protein C0W80_05750 [Photobacterium leiognathi subsp. mandapamensis]|uniref:hypothetical protein n=1 Tax=Photobacterium leiognathi TaxID=553611 RepID=UPI000D178CD9|nr:hypothetical protein [Photobacterium leiognathi]PSV03680.1 hypothetical protein C0W80_05750 [Photobacterium leiognathi subsp. mandapamensis]